MLRYNMKFFYGIKIQKIGKLRIKEYEFYGIVLGNRKEKL